MPLHLAGLLMAVANEEADDLLAELKKSGVHASVIGDTTDAAVGHIYVHE